MAKIEAKVRIHAHVHTHAHTYIYLTAHKTNCRLYQLDAITIINNNK